MSITITTKMKIEGSPPARDAIAAKRDNADIAADSIAPAVDGGW